MTNDQAHLDYFISVKQPAAVICLVGSLTKTTLPLLQQCLRELTQADARYFIFSLRDVDRLDRTVYRDLTAGLKELRMAGKLYCFASVLPKIRSELIDSAILNHSDFVNNLKVALESIQFEEKTAA